MSDLYAASDAFDWPGRLPKVDDRAGLWHLLLDCVGHCRVGNGDDNLRREGSKGIDHSPRDRLACDVLKGLRPAETAGGATGEDQGRLHDAEERERP